MDQQESKFRRASGIWFISTDLYDTRRSNDERSTRFGLNAFSKSRLFAGARHPPARWSSGTRSVISAVTPREAKYATIGSSERPKRPASIGDKPGGSDMPATVARGGPSTKCDVRNALRRGLEFGHRLPLRRKAGGKELPIPTTGDNLPAIARQFVGEVLGVADAEQLRARVVTQAPGRKADRGQVRLQVARRHVDDHAPAPPGAHRLELCGDDVVKPAQREQGARVELAEWRSASMGIADALGGLRTFRK